MHSYSFSNQINVLGIISAFHYTFRQDFNYSGERHNSWEFVYVEAGKIAAKADNKRYIIKSGELICHKPMEYHNLNPYNGNATAIIFSFDCQDEKMSFFENKIISVNKRQKLYLDDIITHAEYFFQPKEPIQIAKDGLMEQRQNASGEDYQFIKNTIELLILSLYTSKITQIESRVYSYTQHLKRKKLTEGIKDYLNEHLGEKINITQIANSFSYSPSTIKTVFKDETGYSIISYYNKLRLESAKKLLVKRSHSISEISEILGFSSPSHFTDFFKKSTGITPKKF